MSAVFSRSTTSAALLSVALLTSSGCPTTDTWVVTRHDGGTHDAGDDPDAVPSCSGLLVSCEGACRDTDVDPNHCGECELGCESDEQCVEGICVCRRGLERCGTDCVDTELDPQYCGGCANDCTGTATPYCNAGSCIATVCEDQSPATVTCGSDDPTCVSAQQMQTSPLHCGDCDDQCEADEICATGECQSYYPAAGCTGCPCNDVCESNLCCTLPGAAVPICLIGATSCP